MFFLDALGPAKRGAYLGELIALMEHHLSEARAHLDDVSEDSDLFGYLGSPGAMKVVEARLDWLKVVRNRLITD